MRGESRYAYLGPEGTFTEAALRLLPEAAGSVYAPFPTVGSALDAVRTGDCVGAVVPLENSVRGVVPATLDELVSGGVPLRLDAEIEVPVTFALMARPGTELADVRRVLSHPHAHGQCHRWLASRLPGAEVRLAASTAAAAREVAESPSPGARYDAAIAAPVAAARYGLSVLASGIGERWDAVTRFVSVRGAGPWPVRTGRDRTSIVVTADGAHSGALVDILAEFSTRGVGLTWIQSWPTGAALGSYHFFLDLDGHVEEAAVGDALMALRRRSVEVCFLGSYPYVGTTRPTTGDLLAPDPPGTTPEAWLHSLREGAPAPGP
ncbi:prephenate dehydratase [Streptomyces hydrogenans]|uniref:prephenate dehydratase n=1 Tax=Streptomyces hydrogenans TaxID=1873719 RepID=UPI00278C47D8|nr:prephenate dehydratase [Streptomyces hydrogenans]